MTRDHGCDRGDRPGEHEAAQARTIKSLERELRIVRAKLARSEGHRARLEELKDRHALLQRQVINELRAASDSVREANSELEQRVAERTRELTEANEALTQARDAALAANRAKGYFLTTMSHELRTPLNAIIGYAEIVVETLREHDDDAPERALPLAQRTARAEQAAGDMRRILGAARHLLAVIDDILDLSKIEAGAAHMVYEPVALRALIESLLDTIRPLARRQENALELVYDEASLPADFISDRTRVRQILYNLLTNATKFTRGGRVELRVRASAASMVFSVRDTGIGIAEEDLEKLFRPFSQIEASASRRFEGTGLGLVLTRSYCRMLGGSVHVESELGRGSTFTVTLPLCPPKVSAIRGQAREASVGAHELDLGGSGRPVVLIDDDGEAREAMGALLGDAGVRVLGTSDVGVGVGLAAAHRPRLVIMDVLRHDGRGWSLLDQLTQELPATPVLVLSQVRASARVLQAGAAGFLLKPAGTREFLRAIRVLADDVIA